MSNTIKVLLSIVIEVAIIVVWLVVLAPWYNSTVINAEDLKTPEKGSTESIDYPPVSDIKQYRMLYHNEDSKQLIIDLMQQNSVKFAVIYDGEANFEMTLRTNDGREIQVIKDQPGPFEFVQELSVPYTGPYLVDVRTVGNWSIEQR